MIAIAISFISVTKGIVAGLIGLIIVAFAHHQKNRINTAKPHKRTNGGSKKHDKHTKIRSGQKKSPKYKPNPNKRQNDSE